MTYCDKFYTCIDSITKIKHGKEIIAMKEKYDHEKLLNEKKNIADRERADYTKLLIYFIIYRNNHSMPHFPLSA